MGLRNECSDVEFNVVAGGVARGIHILTDPLRMGDLQ